MTPAPRRCAIYTRKSSEEGLEQGFNSLDAQREACAAYVLSQAAEGWKALPDIFDDGGYSGGSMERPALKRLLADVAGGRVDTIVVYKIDRLTRSLADFARMVELFDRHAVTFVSVTQAFNTTTSMGRLTLNVLLSFAQFEREVTGERIRDKIAASKARGMWMGGTAPLGYDLPDPTTRALAINEAEAEVVRTIFRQYLVLGSVHALEQWLDQQGIRSKRRITARGRVLGDQPFSRGALFHLLRNRTYRGMIVHRDKAHEGLHPPIIDDVLFEQVQTALDRAARRTKETGGRVATSPLTGRIFDADGQPMSPTFTHGARGQVYRYYVSAPLQRGRGVNEDDVIRRVAGPALEALIGELVERFAPATANGLAIVRRVQIHAESIDVQLAVQARPALQRLLKPGEQLSALKDGLHLTVPVRFRPRGGRTWVLGSTPPAARRDMVLIKALRRAHGMLSRDARGLPMLDASPTSPYNRSLLRLAFLAPDIQEAILNGRHPAGLTLERMMQLEIPACWRAQRDLIAAEAHC